MCLAPSRGVNGRDGRRMVARASASTALTDDLPPGAPPPPPRPTVLGSGSYVRGVRGRAWYDEAMQERRPSACDGKQKRSCQSCLLQGATVVRGACANPVQTKRIPSLH